MVDFDAKLEEAVQVRESGELATSREMFEELFNKAKKGDEVYPRLVAEFVIQLRLEAKELQSKALSLARELEKDDPSDPSGARSVADVLSDLGEHEQTIDRFRKLVHVYDGNSLREGEMQAHLAKSLLRSSRLSEAVESIAGSVDNIRENSAEEQFVEVRESYGLKVESLIALAKGDMDRANELAQEALVVAKRGKAVFRIKEAEELLKMLG